MGLSATALRLAAAHPHALLAVAPGATAVRLEVERRLRERGWPEAAAAADADLVVVCGSPGRQLADAVERLRLQVPAPSAQVEIVAVGDVEPALERAQARLVDLTLQHRGAVERHRQRERRRHEPTGHETGHDGGDGHGNGHGGGHGADGGDGDRGGHEGHGEGAVVAGLRLASRAPDRDGLKLDRLHLPLGPVLPDWPAGLVVRTSLQGDVLQEVEAAVLDGGDRAPEPPFWSEPWLRAASGERVGAGEAARRRAAAHLDSLGRLLTVAGWEAAAVAARRLRDDLLVGVEARALAPRLRPFARRVRASRLLRWSLAGLGVLDRKAVIEHGVAGPALRAGGDVWARLLGWLEETEAALSEVGSGELLAGDERVEGPRGRVGGERPPSLALLEVLPDLLLGSELAGARLIVASLDPDPDELLAERPVAAHG